MTKFSTTHHTTVALTTLIPAELADGTKGHHTVADLGRIPLTGDLTLYVRTDGSDSNDGSANTAGAAFLTIHAAYIYVAQKLDLRGYMVVLQLGVAGTYSGGFSTYGDLTTVLDGSFTHTYMPVGGGIIRVLGDTSNPNGFLIEGSSTGGDDVGFYGAGTSTTQFSIQGVKIKAQWPLFFVGKNVCSLSNVNIEFRGAAPSIYVYGGALLEWYSTGGAGTTISGPTSPAIFSCYDSGSVVNFYPGTMTVSGVTSGDFCYINKLGIISAYFPGGTVTGTIPGKPYDLYGYGGLELFGTTIPAVSAGTTDGRGYLV